MNKGICIYTYIPVRKEPSEASEMVSQILFGETYNILEYYQKWANIELDFDGYMGWIDRKLLYLIDEQRLSWLQRVNSFVFNIPLCIAHQKNRNSSQYILAGSNLYEIHGKKFSLFDKTFQTTEPLTNNKQKNTHKVVCETAMALLNTPYLWGGRSTFGIDCSGFVQTLFKIAGKNLLRDTRQQAKLGVPVKSLVESIPGDVAFFENEEGKIVHTGILLSKNEIIHASGYVHIDPIDDNGIFNSERKEYSHKLSLIRRMIE